MIRVPTTQTKVYHPKGKLEKQLTLAFLNQKTEVDMASFLKDILTPREFREIENRVEVARLLFLGKSYISIAQKLHVSTTTVTRTARWLTSGHGGYKKALGK